MDNFGLRDIPISGMDDESLGLQKYAEALTEFTINCDTPMTIALQGDWGSGKTSMMNLISQELGQPHQPVKVETILFNTWQYSQFGQSENLVVSLIISFIDSLPDQETDTPKKDVVKKGLRLLAGLGKFVAVAGASTFGAGEMVSEGIKSMTQGDQQKEVPDSANQIKSLKENLNKLVEDKLKTSGKDRIVVFIDDLDRLVPEKAVELLEALKLFLDLPGCVFIIACDYHVIVQGLKQKFGVSEGELKGKSFFDKIIQVPFNMPLSQYDVKQYFRNLLNGIKVKFKDSDIDSYVSLVNTSVGFNPRSLKRLFNSLLLLKIVAKGKFDDGQLKSESSERMRMLFGILCMQLSYDSVYRYLCNNEEDLTDNLFKQLKDPNSIVKESEKFQSILTDINADKNEMAIKKLANFMDAFYDAIQLESDGNDDVLSSVEINNLRTIMSFSSVVSTEAGAQGTRGINKKEVFIKGANEIFKKGYDKYIQEWADRNYDIFWGNKGFSAGVKIGGNRRSVFTGRPADFSIIPDKDSAGWSASMEAFSKYKEQVCAIDAVKQTFLENKKFVKNAMIKNEQEFLDFLQATTDFMEAVRDK